MTLTNSLQKATFAGGCFWCTEAIFKNIKGVTKVVSGYSGGNVESPSYQEVSGQSTGHAEAIQITFDPSFVSYEDLVYIFFRTHDPTTLNRQGNDAGPQYRSIIFYHDEEQKVTATTLKERLEKEGLYTSSIVTEIVPFKNFYIAEDYHQNYYQKNKNNFYCKLVIDPKIQKLKKDFSEFLRK